MKLPLVPQRTTTGFAFSVLDRCLKDCLGTRAFAKSEMEQVLAFFFGDGEPECVFCGSKEVKRWDHLVPITEGGETVLGNMVLACARCDDSKQHLVFDQWMLGDAKHSPKSRGVQGVEKRIERIRECIAHFGYEARTLDERLSANERKRLAEIRAGIDVLRSEVESLINDYATRVTNPKK